MHIIRKRNLTFTLDGNVTDELWHNEGRLLERLVIVHPTAEEAERRYVGRSVELEEIRRAWHGT